MRKSVSIFLLATILFQSCAVYHDASISITEAVDKGAVLLTTKDGQTHEYKKILKRENAYYGLEDTNSNSILFDLIPFKTTLDTAEINSIQLKDIKNQIKGNALGEQVC